ncbi:MAG: glycosyltransferase family 39 protein [Phycisphaerae bacterium]|nr:glycosyltransferase family 39 protein [Phycisphaerae bacterium]
MQESEDDPLSPRRLPTQAPQAKAQAPAAGAPGTRGIAGALVVLVVVHAGLGVWSAVRNSVTIDEYAHVAAGAAYWRWGEWSIYNASPPLLRLWATWPVFLLGGNAPDPEPFLSAPAKDRYWSYADAFAESNRSNYPRLIVACRVPMIALSCAGLVLVYAISCRLYGSRAGLASAGLYAFCPNLLAHGSLAGTDSGTSVLLLAAGWAWIRFCQEPTPSQVVGALMAGAGAMLCKFSAILLLPLLVVLGGLAVAAEPRRVRSIATGFAIVVLGMLLVVNLVYGYHGSLRPLGSFVFDSATMQRVQSHLPAWLPVPLPRDFVEGFDAAKWELEQPFQGFLLGQTYVGVRWGYYPLAALVKLPIGGLAIATVAFLTLWVGPNRLRRINAEAMLLVFVTLLSAGICIAATVNIGFRYLLPALPIGYVLAGRVIGATAGAGAGVWVSRGGLGLIVLGAVESVAVAPRFLTFFNVAAGGPVSGQRVVNDSNCDWGQGLIELREWMSRNRVDRVLLAYFGRVDPTIYGVRYESIDAPGDDRYLVVSSYFRTGLAYRAPTPRGRMVLRLPRVMLDALQQVPPSAIVGNVLFVYEQRQVVEAIRRLQAATQGSNVP